MTTIPVLLLLGAAAGLGLYLGLLYLRGVGLLVAAMATGLAAPLLAGRSRRSGEAVLVAHVCAGLAGFVIFLSWISTL
jgi:hypothetical protein